MQNVGEKLTTPDINIYLDTTLMFNDPFFKKNFNRQLLKFARIYGTPLIMSKVVFEETRNKFILNVNKRMVDLEKSIQELKDFYPEELSTEKLQVRTIDFEQKFDAFYQQLVDSNIIEIIEYDNDLLPELVHRSINRIKPFTESKQEFRDAITWLTYTKKATLEEHQHCFFLTGNKRDFCDANGQLHPQLIQDSNKFKIYTSSREFFEKDPVINPLIKTVELEQWLEDNPIDETLIGSLLELHFDYLYEYSKDFLIDAGSSVVDEDDGYTEPYDMAIDDVRDIKVEVINDEIIISGLVCVTVGVELYIYNGYRDREDDPYYHYGSSDVELEYFFTTSYDKNVEEIHHLQIENVYVRKSATVDYEDY